MRRIEPGHQIWGLIELRLRQAMGLPQKEGQSRKRQNTPLETTARAERKTERTPRVDWVELRGGPSTSALPQKPTPLPPPLVEDRLGRRVPHEGCTASPPVRGAAQAVPVRGPPRPLCTSPLNSAPIPPWACPKMRRSSRPTVRRMSSAPGLSTTSRTPCASVRGDLLPGGLPPPGRYPYRAHQSRRALPT